MIQNPESVGTLWKTLSARIRSASTELEELGEETDAYVTSTSKLRDLVKGMTGFDIMEEDGQTYKDIYEIILGIGKEWDRLQDVDKAALAEALAGKRNSNALLAVIGNLDTLEASYEAATNAAGSAEKEQENYAKSLQYSIDKLKASLEELSNDFLNSKSIKDAIDLVNLLVRGIDKVVETLGAIPTIIGTGGIAFVIKQFIELIGVTKNLRTVLTSLESVDVIKGVTDALSGLNSIQAVTVLNTLSLKEADKVLILTKLGLISTEEKLKYWTGQVTYAQLSQTAATTSLTTAVGTLKKSVSGLGNVLKSLLSNPIVRVLAVVGASVFAVNKYLEKQEEKLDNVTEAYDESTEELENLNEQLKSVNQQISDYENIEAPTLVEKSELQKLKEQKEYLEQAVLAQQKLNEETAKKYRKENYKSYKKDFQGSIYPVDKSVWEEQPTSYLFMTATNKMGYDGFNEVGNIINIRDVLSERLSKIDPSKNKKAYDRMKQDIADLNAYIYEAYLNLEEYRQSFEYAGDTASSEYKEIKENLDYVFKAVDPDKYNTKIIDKILGDPDNEWADYIGRMKQAIQDDQLGRFLLDNMMETARFSTYLNTLKFSLKDGETALELFKQQLQAVAKAEEKVADITENTSKELSDWLKSNFDEDNTVQDKIDDFTKNLSTIQSLLESIESGEENLTVGSALNQLPELQPYIDKYQDLGTAIQNYAIDSYNKLLTTLGDTSDIKGATEYFAGLEQQLNEALGSNYHVDTLVDSYKELLSVLDEVKKGHSYSTEEMSYLIDKYNALEGAVIKTADGYTLNQDELKDLINEYVESANTAISTQLNWTNQQIELTQARINAFGLEIQTLRTIANIYKAQGAYQASNYAQSLGADSAAAKSIIEHSEQINGLISALDEYDLLSEQRDELLEKLKEGLDFSSSLNKAKDTEDTYDEIFDYFERRITVLNNSIELLTSNLENVVGSSAKNKLLNGQKALYEEELRNYEDASKMYQEMANIALAKLPDDVASKIKEGAVALEEFVGEANEDVVDAINDYTQWADKVADCESNLAQLKETLRQLELQKFNNIVEDFTNQFDIRQGSIDLIDKQIALFEEAGELIGKSFYEAQAEETKKQLGILKNEQAALVSQMNAALASGYVEAGSEEWLEMVNALKDVESSIYDAETALETFDNKILELHTNVFERIEGYFDNIRSEIDDLVTLIGDEDVATIENIWTDDGLTKLGLYANQYEAAKKQVEDYAEEIAELNNQYLAGKYSSTEYSDKLSELYSAQRDNAKAAQDSLDAILELNEARVDIVVEGINKEIEEYEKLIDAQKKALQSEKDLHDYENSIAESNKNIQALQRQIAALSGDTSASAIAKTKQLQSELVKAQEELTEKQYDHSISEQERALDEQMENYRTQREDEIEALQETLKNEEQIYAESFAVVKANAATVAQELETLALEHGINISTSLTNAWEAGETAIADYGTLLTSETSVFIGELQTIEDKTWELQNQANITSETIAAVFTQKADGLVSELNESYVSVENLNETVQSLQDSFHNALERGYDISSILNNLNAVKKAVEEIPKVDPGLDDDGNPPKAEKGDRVEMLGGQFYWKSANGTTKGVYATMNDLKKARGFVKGVHNINANELAWTQEYGKEAILSPTRNAILTPLKSGDSVLNADMTDNIWRFAKNPADFLSKIHVPKIEQSGNNLSIGNVLTVNGNIDSSNIEEIKTYTSRAINAAFAKLNSGLQR